MFSMAPFLTGQYMPDPNKAAANAVAGMGMRQQGDLERQRQKTAHEEFGTEQERLREQTGLDVWSRVYGMQQQALGPLIQKHADLIGEGSEESLRAARSMEEMMGNLGLSIGPPGGDQGQGQQSNELPAQELQNQQTARARNQIIYGMSPPAYLPPVGQQYQPQASPTATASPNAPASPAPQPPARVAPQGRKATAVQAEESSGPAVEAPAEVRQAAQEENARNYGPIFRAAPAYLPSPGSVAQEPPDRSAVTPADMAAIQQARQANVPEPIGVSRGNERPEAIGVSRGAPERENLAAKAGPKGKASRAAAMPTPEAAQASRFAAGEKVLEAAPAQTGTIGNTGQQPQPYGLYMNGRHIGDVNPAEIIARTQTEGQRLGRAIAEGTDPQFRPLIEKMFANAKSKGEVEQLMKIFGTPEIQSLIHERSSVKSSAAMAAARGGRQSVLDYQAGMAVEEKSANDNQVKDSIGLYRTIHQARQALRGGNPIATQDAVRMVAKLQNYGVLTDKDAEAPRLLLSQREKLFDWLKGKTVGDLTEETKKMFLDYLEQKEAVLDEQIRSVHDAEIDAQKSHAIPSYEAQEGWKARMHSRYGNMPWYNRKTVDSIGGGARPRPNRPPEKPSYKFEETGKGAPERVKDRLKELPGYPGR